MDTLIVKLNATGDVVRTTPLLRRLGGNVSWITAAGNTSLLEGIASNLRCIAWEDRATAIDRSYDLAINLEDEVEAAEFVASVSSRRIFGARLGESRRVVYTDDAAGWFDMSLISRFGRAAADDLKLRNRRTYQDLLFEGLGFVFSGEPYLLPQSPESDLAGDVAMASVAGPVWPMKNWAHFGELRRALEQQGLRVNELPRRATLLEHLADVRNHRCVVGGDSLPMHLALGSAVPCVTIFNCTSPWEICDYGIQTKMISPLLDKYWYKRNFDPAATSAISIDDVLRAVTRQLSV